MRQETMTGRIGTAAGQPAIRRIGPADLREALKRGLEDFRAKPSHVVFLCILYPIVALVLGRLIVGYQVLPVLFPLAAGFALVGPVAAVGLYELSRRREAGLPLAWRDAFDVMKPPRVWSILSLGLVMAALFVAWQTAAIAIYRATLGAFPQSLGEFAERLFTTADGWILIVAGNAVGFLFAVVALAVGVVSFPMLVDRPVEPATALWTSVRAVAANPLPMLAWGLIVAVALLLGTLPLFVGLALVLPLLGHATWHLYRRTVMT
ncbi:Uncharacterized membrane protein [Tistlia consotensis]|uniref:Uncharacterized membrane protein n=1 Tax=Tistlia consotensis USBA 355 TaxID=560819 RepID=A0A1Y6B3N0_9PROT|nr:DUF2189 domain-containing protein [Tistlia consotensis]SME89867.1 Uncharacterized membrane protein [Tistlia consotensis USBA 355]SNR26363.1 Uncharacterized membrane protein [Tistlia consotensis]